jgi:hypothetical protein
MVEEWEDLLYDLRNKGSPATLVLIYQPAWCYISEHYNLKITFARIQNITLSQKCIEEMDKKFQKLL